MARLRGADRQDLSKTSILELAKDVRKAQALRAAELERASRSYQKALEGSLPHAAEFLQMVRKGDAVYERAMLRAHERYRTARDEGREPAHGD